MTLMLVLVKWVRQLYLSIYIDGDVDVDAEERRGGFITLSFLFQL